MKLQQSFQLVPRPVRVGAAAIFFSAVPIGLLVGYRMRNANNAFHTMPLTGLAALGVGAVVAFWLLAVGFVYADARRRNMRPVPWALVVICFPHLLGFLFYFVMRQPIASFCSHCGGVVSGGQRFCPTCGQMQSPANLADPRSIPPGVNLTGAD